MTTVQENLGDIPSEQFRAHLHQLADWIADYRENLDERPVAPNEKPGAVLAEDIERTARIR